MTAKPARICMENLNEILGKSVTSAIIYYLGGAESLQDPKVFERVRERLEAAFGAGANVILKRILKNAETS